MSDVPKCLACLEPRQLNEDGLCERCALHNDSVDGTLLALLNAPESSE